MKLERVAAQFYQHVIEQADIIYPASCNDPNRIADRNRLKRILHLSMNFCCQKPEYLLLTLYINRLARLWDDMREDKIPNRQHSFVIIDRSSLDMYNLQKYQGMLALMYDYKNSPDNRIIVIAIDRKLRIHQNLYGILHEVGHYVGCRQRKTPQPNRINFFVDLSLQSFLRSIFLNACSSLLNESEVSNAVLSDPSYHEEYQQIMQEMLICLSDNSLYSWLYQTLMQNVDDILKSRSEDYTYLYAYKKAVTSAIHLSFQRIFDSSDQKNKLLNQLHVNITTYHLNEEIYTRLTSSIDQVIIQQTPLQGKEFSEYDWGVNVGNLLMEVAADVFMVRFLDIGSMYLKHMLCSYKKQYSDWEQRIENELLNDTGERTRLVCLQAACMNFVKQKHNHTILGTQKLFNCPRMLSLHYNKFLCISNKLNETIDTPLKVHYIDDQRIYQLDNSNVTNDQLNQANQLRILNPCVTLSEYVRLIMKDQRYDIFFRNAKTCDMVKNLRAFRHRPRFLLRWDAMRIKDSLLL